MRTEYIYRDALAVELGGVCEGRVDDDRTDIVIHHQDYDEICEVKYAADLRTAIGQVESYAFRRQKQTGKRQCKSIHAILSPERYLQQSEIKRINTHAEEMADKGILLSTVVSRKDLPVYRLGDIEISDRSMLLPTVKQIKRDFAYHEYFSPENKKILYTMAQAYCMRRFQRTCSRVELRRTEKGVVTDVYTASSKNSVKNSELIKAYREMAHYRWLKNLEFGVA